MILMTVNKNQYCNKDIAIIGVSGKFPEADNLKEFWYNLKKSKESIRLLPDSRVKELEEFIGKVSKDDFIYSGYVEEISFFDPEYFSLSEEETRYIDPQQRLLLELVETAIQNAGYSTKNLSSENVGIFMASSQNLYGSFIKSLLPMALNNNLEAAIAGRVAYTFDFRGPSLTIDTACSSSLTALHYACQALRNNECDYALVGGVRLNVIPNSKEILESSPISSKNQQVRAFDKDADGTVGGEGGAVLLIKRAQKAVEDRDLIHAIIKGSAVNSDGRRSTGFNAPNQYSQAAVIERAISNAGIDPTTISYLEAHGTGTKIGDPIEVGGINLAFSKYTSARQKLPIGSLKTNIGHLDTAAGIAGVTKVVLALKHKQIPASINYDSPNPHIEFFNSPVYVNNTLTDWNSQGVRRAGVTSLGLTGTNVHLILEEGPETYTSQEDSLNIFTLSAKNEDSLAEMCKNLGTYLENTKTSLNDIAYTLNWGRNHFRHRIALTSSDKNDLINKLKSKNFYKNTLKRTDANLLPVFIFPDFEEDAVNSNLVGELSESEQLFKEFADECLQKVFSGKKGRYFVYQYAYAKLLIASGIDPKAVLGVGFGKCVSDVIQNKISLEEGIEGAESSRVNTQSVPEDKLKNIIEKMIKDGHNLFVILGEQSQLGKRIQHILAEKSNISVVNLSANREDLYHNICAMYVKGAVFNWDSVYYGQDRWKVELPTYAFKKRSILLKKEAIKDGLQCLNKTGKFDSLKAENKQVTFDEILMIFSEVSVDEIKLDQAFEEAGGDSITAMQIGGVIKRTYQVTIPLDIFYAISTTDELIQDIVNRINGIDQIQPRIASETTGREVLVDTNTLTNDDLDKITCGEKRFDNILLTGATGFYGAHVLKDLMEMTDSTIYCLNRGDSLEDVNKRLKARLEFYFKDGLAKYWDERIRVIWGDIVVKKLGLSHIEYTDLAQKIDAVINSAGDVRHYGNAEHFHNIHVTGTQNLLDFCFAESPTEMHHISTMAVRGMPTEKTIILESELDIKQDFSGNVYSKSKFDAEKIVLKARGQGLKASIYRVGTLVGRFDDGQFQPNIEENELSNNLKAIIALGKIPQGVIEEVTFELTPVDLCSQALLKIMKIDNLANNTYHLANPNFVPMGLIKETLDDLGYKIEAMENEKYYDYVYDRVENEDFNREITSIYTILRAKNDDEPTKPSHRMAYSTIFTEKALALTNFSWPEIGKTYLTKMLAYSQSINYLPKPQKVLR